MTKESTLGHTLVVSLTIVSDEGLKAVVKSVERMTIDELPHLFSTCFSSRAVLYHVGWREEQGERE